MKIKEIILTVFITFGVCILFGFNYIANKYNLKVNSVYKVYLDGNIIGYITDDDELYSIINKKQTEIKNKYKVDNVYPPNNFKIIKTNSYNVEISSAEQIYTEMAKLGSFTVKGYIITIKDEEDKKKIINVLYREDFDEAIHTFLNAFLSEKEYNDYIENTQEEIETTGKKIDLMYFDENISIKEGFVSVNDKIYTNKTELSQYLLFGDNYELKNYEVASGDSIESISNANKLNPEEFLIANPKYTSVDSLLVIGDKVNITLINPVLTFTYEVTEVSDTEIPYEKKVQTDNSKPANYSEITTAGVTGITRITQKYAIKNGEKQSGVDIKDPQVIVEKIDQVTTVGKSYRSSAVSGSYVDTGSQWQWPTNYPYVLTSGFAWRWGVMHEGIDISGTGYNSPIYAALDGVIISAGWEGLCGSGGGYCIVIDHENNYYTIYGHLAQGSLKVKTGDRVSRGQVIGGMGSTGYSTGTHLHFGVSTGVPYQGGSFFNPLRLWK